MLPEVHLKLHLNLLLLQLLLFALFGLLLSQLLQLLVWQLQLMPRLFPALLLLLHCMNMTNTAKKNHRHQLSSFIATLSASTSFL